MRETVLTRREQQEIAERVARRALRRGELVPFNAYQTLGAPRVARIKHDMNLLAAVVAGGAGRTPLIVI